MSTITIAGITLPDWHLSTDTTAGAVQLRLYATQTFLTSAGTIIPGGSPNGGALYQQVPCDVAGPDANGNYTLTIPSITIDSTTDSPDPVSTAARYSAWYFAGKRMLAPAILGGPTGSFRILPTYSTIPANWSEIWLDNTQGAPQSIDLVTYTKQQINYLISQGVGSAGISSLNGLTAAMQYFANDTNVTIVSAIDTHTITWVGTLAVARGGTGSGTAAGARTNLGAAKSGANSDITSIVGLTTALTSPQGGTGFGTSNPYTVGSLLYADSTTTLTQIVPGTAGFVLLSQGPGLAPVWAAAAGTIGGGGAAGRVSFWSAATTLSSSATYLFDSGTSRLSVGTTESSNTINLGNAGYVSGHGSVAAAQVQMAAIADQTKYTGVATTTTVDAITLGSSVPVAHVYTDGGATPLLPLAPDNQVRANGIRVGFGTAGAYNDSSSSNIFHFTAQASNIGTGNTVAIFSEAYSLGAGSSVWAINPVAYTNVGGVTTASAIMMEGNFGALGVSPNQSAYGMVLAANSDPAAPAGTNKAFFQMQANGSYSSVVNGIVFSDGSGQAVTNAQINAQATTATYAGLFTLCAYSTGFDFAGSTFSSGNQIRLANGGAASSGITAQNNAGSAEYNAVRMTTADYLEYGDGDSGLTGIRFLASAGSADTLRFLGGATGLPGNAGWNQSTPTAQQHVTAIAKRALTGTNFVTSTVSTTVTAAGSAFLSEVAPGSSIVFSTEPSTLYTVTAVASDTSLTINTTPAVNTAVATATSDYRTLLIESAAGEDWLELSNQHTLKLYGNSTYSDLIGQFSLVNRANTQKRLAMGVDNTGSYSYISSFQETVGWKPLILQGGASNADTGGVVIGVPTPSVSGAMLKVEGAGAKTANHVATEFNNISTSVATFQKISAQYLSQGSWVGPNFSIFAEAIGASDSSSEDLTNVPLGAFGGKNFFGPHSSQVTSPAPPDNTFTAVVDVYGVPTDSITRSGSTVTTVAGNATINNTAGPATTWNTPGSADYVQPGDTVMVSNEAGVIYTVTSVAGDTAFDVTPVIAGGGAGLTVRRDPYLLRARNSYGTEKFRVEPSGNIVLGGAAIQGAKTKALTAGVATSFVTIMVPSNDYIGGYIDYTIVADDGTDFQSLSGILPFAAVNKAGTETAVIGTVTTATEVVASSSGATLTNTFTAVTTPTNGISLQANAASSLVETTLEIRYHVRITSGDQVTVTPL